MMNLKLKSLVAAVVLAASIPAHAALDDGNAANGSSLVLTLLDTTANISASFDLGYNYSDFNIAGNTGYAVSSVANPGALINWNLASNSDYSSAWNAFWASATSANTVWAVSAADVSGIGNGAIGIVSTYSGTPATYSSANMVLAANNFAQTNTGYIANMGSPFSTTSQNHSSVADGADVAKNTDPAQINAISAYGFGIGNFFGSGPGVTGAVGSALQVAQYTNNTARNAAVVQNVFGNNAQFLLDAQGNLTYSTAAVPEADTSAMMLAGLGLMGFIARRRTKA